MGFVQKTCCVFFCLQTHIILKWYKDIFQNISLNYNPILEVCRSKTKAKKKKKKEPPKSS